MPEFDPQDCWEALFDSTYLRWFDLNGKPALVTITELQKRVELTLKGGAKKFAPVVVITQENGSIEHVKPLVLNKTNGNAIYKIHGVPSKWVGKQIVLFQDVTQMGREVVPCIRIRAKKEAK